MIMRDTWRDIDANRPRYQHILNDAIVLLKEQEADKPKTGHWIYKKYDDMFMCSCCGKYSIRNDYPYCHWCGAKMEGR